MDSKRRSGVNLNLMLNRSDIPEQLIRNVIAQSGGWRSFILMAEDINRHGIDGGFSGWIYYSQTMKFWKANKTNILKMAENMAKDLGLGTYEMIQGFRVFRDDLISTDELVKALYTGEGDMACTVQNAMAWFAAEEVVRLYCDLLDEDKR